MLKRKFAILALAVSFSFVLNNFNSVSAHSLKGKRLWGKDRYETCASIVKEGWKTSDYAVLVNGENFPDSLSAGVLAKKYNAPILLTEKNYLGKEAHENLTRLGVKQLFIVGGEGVVQTEVENSIKALGIKVKRYGGEDRIKTSVEVAKHIGIEKGIILTSEGEFADALSIMPVAGKLQMPIILMPKDNVPLEVKELIKNKQVAQTYILGEEAIIDKKIENSFKNVKRIGGSSKYDKNINILKHFSDNLNFQNVYIAYSEKFADALSVAPLAALNNNPVILVGDEPYKVTMDFVKSKMNDIYNVNILGGISGIDEDVCNSLINGGSMKANSLGNTSGNLSNYGYYSCQGNWSYYSNFDDNKKLYKMRKDGSSCRKISDNSARFINVVGDWIYYVTKNGEKSFINKVKTDGSGEGAILENQGSIMFLNVCKDKLFYLSSNCEDGTITKCCLNEATVDGTFISKIFAFEQGFTPWYLNIDGDYAYCIIDISGGSGVYKIDLKNRNINKLVDDALFLNVSEGWIYYVNHNGIYKVKSDGSKNQKISDDFPASTPDGQWGDPGCLNVEENWIYYKSFNDQCVYKVNINGGERVKLGECVSDSVNLAGDYIYCHKYSLEDGEGFYKYCETVKIKK